MTIIPFLLLLVIAALIFFGFKKIRNVGNSTFGEAVRAVYKEKYFTFSGRASRSEYWWSVLFWWSVLLGWEILIMLIMALTNELILSNNEIPPVFTWLILIPMAIFVLATIIPGWSAIVRRLHDRNMSGWWALLFLVLGVIPYVGILSSVILIVLLAKVGSQSDNRFGPNPLNRHS